MAAAAACAAGLPPGILFAPEDEVAVGHYLLPRLLGWQLPIDGLILNDDPLSAPPQELLERNGRKEEAFFFAEGQARCGKGTRQKRTCAGGGWWEGQKTSAERDKLRIPGGGGKEAAWRKKALNFHCGGGAGGKKGSTGWVMHEYSVTAPEDLARSPLRLYHIRLSSFGRKQIGGMEVPRALGLPPGFLFAPEDGDVVAHYLLRRILGQPLPLDGLILDDDPLSARPWELLERNGCKDDAFFFAFGQAKSSKGSRQKRTCAGGGFWNGERTCADGKKLRVPGLGGAEVAWRKKSLSFQEDGEKGSTGWVMHEYAITAPDHLADSQLRLYRIRFSGHGKKRKRGDEDPCIDEAAPTAARRRVAEDALLDISTSQPSTQPICSSSMVITDADQHTTPGTVPANQDFTSGIAVDTSWDNFDIDELLRSIADWPSTDLCVLAAGTDQGAHLDADAASSSFFSQTVAAASQYNGVGIGLLTPSAPALYHGCMEPADSFFFTMPNQSYAAC
ncbi:hypothetical protein BAE44_0012245 [Dichanthelium oligosanthes]|uniref:NAC domain-containing protein n=1 Tax=Dichanthelium oligosanthes TaxID=888268 RepID=A0A1E5VNP1_9POAL|nr:hypothetical protein BAE44_0012245 [Dichanthelium oligosanthes]